MVGVIKWSDGHGCAVLQYSLRERSQCLVQSPYKVVRQALCGCFLEKPGLEESSRRWLLWPLLLWRHLKQWGSGQNPASPHFPLAAGKRLPCVARAAAGAAHCLRVAKAARASFVLLKAPGWGGLILAQHRLGVDGCLLCEHMEMCQCNGASTSRNTVGARLALTSDNDKHQWSCGFTHLTFVWGFLFGQHRGSKDELYLCVSIKRLI